MPQNKSSVRRHFFIDRKLQGRYMMTFLIPMLIMLVFMLGTLFFASETIVRTTAATIKRDIQAKTTLQMQDNLNPSTADYRQLMTGINEYLREFSSNREYRRVLLISLLWVFGGGLLLLIIQIVLMTIFFSHKVAGPIYRFERVCHELINGNYNQQIVLRRGDEMQNLARLLNQVIKTSRERILALKNASDESRKNDVIADLKL
jgi:nitrogen fixation/metabolism regulation signal transduction histidine kinase